MIEFSLSIDRLTGNRIEINGNLRRTGGSRRERERWVADERAIAATALISLKAIADDTHLPGDAARIIEDTLGRIGELE